MKHLKASLLITGIMVASSATLMAQTRQDKTSSAKAAYGYPTKFKSSKKKHKKSKKADKRNDADRRKKTWAG
jgi:hypothetical protein